MPRHNTATVTDNNRPVSLAKPGDKVAASGKWLPKNLEAADQGESAGSSAPEPRVKRQKKKPPKIKELKKV